MPIAVHAARRPARHLRRRERRLLLPRGGPRGRRSPSASASTTRATRSPRRCAPSSIALNGTEGDSQFVASQVYDFETDTEGWTTTAGTFNRTNAAPGGAGGRGHLLLPVVGLPRQPVRRGAFRRSLSLTATSTLSLQNNYDIEPFSAGSWYDRANVGAAAPGRRAHRGLADRRPSLQRERRRRRLRPRQHAGLGRRQPHLGRRAPGRPRALGLPGDRGRPRPPEHQVRDRRGGQRSSASASTSSR